jgi:hypothetical protein
VVYAPATVSLDRRQPDRRRKGKTLEIDELTTGTDLLSRCAYALSATPVTWVSKASAATALTSASEYKARLSVARQVDNSSEDISAGGDVVLQVGYKGTTGSLTLTSTALTTSVTGGTGGTLSLTLSTFPTVADLVAYINTQTGYSASVGSAGRGNSAPGRAGHRHLLDRVGLRRADRPDQGRRVQVLQRGLGAVAASSCSWATPRRSPLGRPEDPHHRLPLRRRRAARPPRQSWQAAVLALREGALQLGGPALLAAMRRRTSPDGLTDSGSTYTDRLGINAACGQERHLLATAKIQRKPQSGWAFCSYRGSLANAKAKAAANLSSARASTCPSWTSHRLRERHP